MQQNSEIRIAQEQDLPAVVAIYNQAVVAGFQTAHTTEQTAEERQEWFEQHSPEVYPLLVAMVQDDVAGWLSISPYRPGREALQGVVEISYYIHSGYRRQGLATMLLKQALTLCATLGYRHVFAIIMDRNEASIALMKKHGFIQWGHLPDVALFGTETCGQVYFGRPV